MKIMIKDLKQLAAGTEIKGFPLLIKTARKTFKDTDGVVYQEVIFMDASGEITGHILMEESGEELAYRAHNTSGLPAMVLWKSKTNLCIMEGVLQYTDERGRDGMKLVVNECFDAATPLTYNQGQDLQAEDWKKLRENEIEGKIRHGIICSCINANFNLFELAEGIYKKPINSLVDFIMKGE